MPIRLGNLEAAAIHEPVGHGPHLGALCAEDAKAPHDVGCLHQVRIDGRGDAGDRNKLCGRLMRGRTC